MILIQTFEEKTAPLFITSTKPCREIFSVELGQRKKSGENLCHVFLNFFKVKIVNKVIGF